jgi:hypothetical protein
MAENMGVNFVKYFEMLFPVVQELIVIKYSREIRGNMIECCKYMVLTGRTLEEKAAILINVYPLLSQSLSESIRCKDHV